MTLAVLAYEGTVVPMSDLFGVVRQRLLDEVPLADAYPIRVESLREPIEASTGIAFTTSCETRRWPPPLPATSATTP